MTRALLTPLWMMENRCSCSSSVSFTSWVGVFQDMAVSSELEKFPNIKDHKLTRKPNTCVLLANQVACLLGVVSPNRRNLSRAVVVPADVVWCNAIPTQQF